MYQKTIDFLNKNNIIIDKFNEDTGIINVKTRSGVVCIYTTKNWWECKKNATKGSLSSLETLRREIQRYNNIPKPKKTLSDIYKEQNWFIRLISRPFYNILVKELK